MGSESRRNQRYVSPCDSRRAQEELNLQAAYRLAIVMLESIERPELSLRDRGPAVPVVGSNTPEQM